MEEGDDFEIEEETHNVGKDNKPQEFAVITNFSDLPIKIRLQEEYYIPEKSQNKGKIQKRMVIKNFFRADGASAEEIVNESEIGKRLATEQEKYASNVTYRNNLTPEDIEEYYKAKKDERSSDKPSPKASSKPKTSGSIFK